MQSMGENDGTLLAHSAILYGAGMADGDGHVHHKIPILLVGGAAGRIKAGRHLQVPNGTPLTNLHLTLLDKVGVHVEQLGESTGALELVFGV
jgi:hypothetical protein